MLLRIDEEEYKEGSSLIFEKFGTSREYFLYDWLGRFASILQNLPYDGNMSSLIKHCLSRESIAINEISNF